MVECCIRSPSIEDVSKSEVYLSVSVYCDVPLARRIRKAQHGARRIRLFISPYSCVFSQVVCLFHIRMIEGIPETSPASASCTLRVNVTGEPGLESSGGTSNRKVGARRIRGSSAAVCHAVINSNIHQSSAIPNPGVLVREAQDAR